MFGCRPLHGRFVARRSGSKSVKQKGSRVRIVFALKRYKSLIASKNRPLHYAVIKSTQCVKLLLEHHADPNLRTPAGQSPLLVALQVPQAHGAKDTVLTLLEHAATDLTVVVPTTHVSLLTIIDRVLPRMYSHLHCNYKKSNRFFFLKLRRSTHWMCSVHRITNRNSITKNTP